MDDLTLPGAAGLFGVFLYVAAYAAMQMGLVRGQTYVYAGLNLAAASCVLFSLTETYNLSSALIQIMWIVLSIAGMLRLWLIERTMRFSEREQRIIASVVPGLPKDRARKFLDIGKWSTAARGAHLITEGQPTALFAYLESGTLRVSINGVTLRTLGAETVIGEITYIDGSPATASIDVIDDVRFFWVDAVKLRAFVAKNPDIGNAIERSVAHTLRKKLRETSEHLHGTAKAV